MKTAQAWRQAQLLQYQTQWQLQNQAQLSKGFQPVHPNPEMICLSVPSAMDPKPTVTDTLPPCHHCQHPYLSPLAPHNPGTWPHLVSTVSKLRQWSLDLPSPLTKVVKIPLQFREENCPPIRKQPEESSPTSQHRELRYWTYMSEDIKEEDPHNPLLYSHLDHILTHARHQHLNAQACAIPLSTTRGMSSTGTPTLSLSTSSMSTGVKPPLISSSST
jgi:hypothetical protein